MHPFTGLATREDGAIKVCCRSLPIGNIKNDEIDAIRRTTTLIEIIAEFLFFYE